MSVADSAVLRASLLIRNLDPVLKRALRLRAAVSGVSMEEEARRILASALVEFARAEASPPASLGAAMAMLFGRNSGVELDAPPRETGRAPPDFDEAGMPWGSSTRTCFRS